MALLCKARVPWAAFSPLNSYKLSAETKIILLHWPLSPHPALCNRYVCIWVVRL